MKNKTVLYLLVVAFIYMSAFTGCNGTKTTLKESTKSENMDIQLKLQDSISGYVEKYHFNGSVLVARNGDILLDRGYGMADFSKNIPNSPNTVFQIASLTKQFTSMAILMLQEKGKLNINDKINKYLPDYPSGDKISIYNLLTHTSGISDYVGLVNANKGIDYIWSPDNIIALFKNLSPNFEPGTRYEYSNSNYILLGYIIEKVSGIKYEDFINENILRPLNMSNTGFDYNKEIKDLAVGYSYIAPTPIKSPRFNMTAAYSAGGLHSTVEDLYKWDQALYTEKLINKESLKQMYTPYLDNYALGVEVRYNNNETIISHGGRVFGFLSYYLRNIDNKYTIIFMTNVENQQANDTDLKLMNELQEILDSANIK